MCGIVGVLSEKITLAQRKMFEQMHFFDRLRGEHSSGIIGVHKDGTRQWYKRAVPTPDFYLYKPALAIKDDVDNRVLIGHNRHATVGKVNDINAHPFEHYNIVGVHNGTLTSRIGLKDSSKFPVDSDNIMHNLATEGAVKTIPELRGAFTLVWHDAEDNTVHFVRNDERPLWFATDKKDKAMYFASEAWMIEVAARKAKIDINKPMELDTGVEVIVKVANLGDEDFLVDRKHKLHEPVYGGSGWNYNNYTANRGAANTQSRVRGANTGGANVRVNYNTGDAVSVSIDSMHTHVNANGQTTYYAKGLSVGNRNFEVRMSQDLWDWLHMNKRYEEVKHIRADFLFSKHDKHKPGTDKYVYVIDATKKYSIEWADGHKSTDVDTLFTDTLDADDVPFDDSNILELFVKGYDGRQLSMKRYRELTKCGCAVCSSPVVDDDHKDIKWLNENDFICPVCTELEEQGYLDGVL